MNLLVMCAYWPFLHAQCLERFRAANDSLSVVHTCTVHSIPFIANVCTFMVTDIAFKASHALVLFPLALFYAVHNYWA